MRLILTIFLVLIALKPVVVNAQENVNTEALPSEKGAEAKKTETLALAETSIIHKKEDVISINPILPKIREFSTNNTNKINWTLVDNDSLEVIRKYASRIKDYCLKSEVYYQRAVKNPDYTVKLDKRIEDLKMSSIYAEKFCRDTVAYYKARIKIAEFLYTNSLSPDYAIDEANEALQYFTSKNLTKYMIDTYHVLAFINEKKYEPDSALVYLTKASKLSLLVNDSIGYLKNRPLFNSLTYLIGNRNISLASFKEDFEISCRIPQKDHSVTIDIGLSYAEHLLEAENYEQALNVLNFVESLDIKKNNQIAKLYDLAIKTNNNLGNYETALSYSLESYDALQNSHNTELKARIENSIQVTQNKELESDYEELQQEKDRLGEKLSLRSLWLVYLGIAILASLLALYYITRFYTQKIRVSDLISDQREEINKQRIVKLENNMKIQSLSSMVAGQEAERNRIANDLHDSLGGTLSALKLQFENVVLKNSKSEDSKFANISKLIDGACSEVREIARNLKPASLENIGLEAAIRDLINKYNANTDVEISFNSYVEDIEVDYETKLNMYRIIQELLNNVMKHAKATEVDVQLSKSSEELIINVEDNGEGFNINWVKKGLGLDSMQSRVNVLQGDLNIDTAPGRGTSVIVHIPIKMELV